MLTYTDRMRLICKALDLTQDDLVEGLVAGRTKVKKRRAVKKVNLQATVGRWWRHSQQPDKSLPDLLSFLDARAKAARAKFNVQAIWNEELTPFEFAEMCGLDKIAALEEVSPVCKRTVFELFNTIPFLKALPLKHQTRSEPRSLSVGTYAIYRIHSSRRRICREVMTVERQSNYLHEIATYFQYIDSGAHREITLSVFPVHKCTHAVGSYTDSLSTDAEAAHKNERQSLLHMIIFDSAFEGDAYSGLIADLTDHDHAVSAERFFLRKIDAKVISKKKQKVTLVGDEKARCPEEEALPQWKSLRRFLQNDNDDEYLLLANQLRIGKFLSHNLSQLK